MGRYLIYDPIASGGMATVFYGAILGESGFSRIVAIKRVRSDKKSRTLLRGLIDEARLASRIKHPNVVATLDVVAHHDESLIVLDYVAGETLASLLRQHHREATSVPLRIATGVVAGVLHGLHAAHEAKSVQGKPLSIVHRDVSPQNVLVGFDGVARVLDFGIAKADERLTETRHGQVKGKPAYLAPEQLKGESDRRTDIYAAGVVLWELISGRRLFYGKSRAELIEMLFDMTIDSPRVHVPDIPEALEAVVMRALSREPADRFGTARDFALALEDGFGVATATQIGRWVESLSGDVARKRRAYIEGLEQDAANRAHARTSDGSMEEAPPPEVTPLRESVGKAATPAKRPPTGMVTEVDQTVSTRIHTRAPRPAELPESEAAPAAERPLAVDDAEDEQTELAVALPFRGLSAGVGAVLVLLTATVAITAYTLAERSGSSQPSTTAGPPPSSPAPTAVTSARPNGTAAEPLASVASSADAAASPSAGRSSAVARSPVPSSPSSRPRVSPPSLASSASPPPKPPPAPSATSTRGDPCNPPWRYVDGLKIPKPGCN